jgi:tetraacyldisaccharide 4'-kinase
MSMARNLLLPLSLLYRFGLALRSSLYRAGIYKRTEFDLPIISVGNLSTGGTGKTPHIEYLIRLLRARYPVSTLSRGYGRKTSGFRVAGAADTADTIGDEPMQYHYKFNDISVAVGEQRALAVPELLVERPETQIVLLDDAFQHLAILPGMNILLTEYGRLYTRDNLLPAGNLREPRSAASRADILIVTKCPPALGAEEQVAIRAELAPLPHQSLYFTTLDYEAPVPVAGESTEILSPNLLLLTGIARPGPLLEHLKAMCKATCKTFATPTTTAIRSVMRKPS